MMTVPDTGGLAWATRKMGVLKLFAEDGTVIDEAPYFGGFASHWFGKTADGKGLDRLAIVTSDGVETVLWRAAGLTVVRGDWVPARLKHPPLVVGGLLSLEEMETLDAARGL